MVVQYRPESIAACQWAEPAYFSARCGLLSIECLSHNSPRTAGDGAGKQHPRRCGRKEPAMILQWHLPFDVPGVGKAGEAVTYYAVTGRIERHVVLPDSARDPLIEAIPFLPPIGPSLPATAAIALIRAGVRPHASRHLRLVKETAYG